LIFLGERQVKDLILLYVCVSLFLSYYAKILNNNFDSGRYMSWMPEERTITMDSEELTIPAAEIFSEALN